MLITAFFAMIVSLIQHLATVRSVSPVSTKSSEYFSSAGRGISSGWIACHIVSQWTWAATLLQSSNVAFTFGVSGPFWYAALFNAWLFDLFKMVWQVCRRRHNPDPPLCYSCRRNQAQVSRSCAPPFLLSSFNFIRYSNRIGPPT